VPQFRRGQSAQIQSFLGRAAEPPAKTAQRIRVVVQHHHHCRPVLVHTQEVVR
jgi:hypothetical protein